MKNLGLLLIFILLASCSSSKHRHREGDNSGQSSALTVNQEREMTKKVLPQMRKDYPPVKDPELQRYIRMLGNKIVRANNLHNNPYKYSFTVVDVDYVNAFALPAGTVFITAPLIAMASNEAELAGVVGHEIGHITARHSAERMYAAQKSKKKSWLYGGAGAIVGGAAGYGLGKLLCSKKDKKCLAKASLVGAAAGAGGGLLIQKYGFMANSREDEMEADRIGFRLSLKAGYHKDHIGRFYEKLLMMEQKSKRGGNPVMKSLADAMSTHPPSQKRVNQMREMAREVPVSGQSIITTRNFRNAHAKSKDMAKK